MDSVKFSLNAPDPSLGEELNQDAEQQTKNPYFIQFV